ncbi:O-antigen ligase family protein [uncultured Maribacter sp.]|uniref:O-antigen ligase family protein n=1 Tax=uncultured Maribacter sp. TaxID=431308 RepID=UPI0030D743E3
MSFIKRNLIFALALLPLLNIAMTNVALALFVVVGIVSFAENKENRIGSLKNLFFDLCCLSIPVLLAVIALIWTQDLKTGWSFVERSLPFLVIPLVVFLGRPIQKKQQINKFLKIFIISAFVLAVIVLINILVWYVLESHIIAHKSFEDYVREGVGKIPFFNEHAIYLSLLLGSALLFLFYNTFEKIWLNVLVVIVLIMTMVLLSSRGPLIALFIVFIGMVLFKKRNLKFKVFTMVGFVLFTVMIILFSPLKNRMIQLISTKHLYPQGEYFNSVNLRAAIFTCSYKVGLIEPIFGLGPGDVQKNLNECYQNNFRTTAFDKGIFNSHNQLLFYWVSYGFVGLIIFLAVYFLFVRKALSRKQHLYLSFLIFMALCSLSENILNRNTGIMLFSIFNSFFYFSNYLKE